MAGDGYRGKMSPHTPNERFEGATVLKTLLVGGAIIRFLTLGGILKICSFYALYLYTAVYSLSTPLHTK